MNQLIQTVVVLSQVAEGRYEALQEHCTGLEREVADLRAELREARAALEKGAESQKIGSHEAELSALRQQVGIN